MIQKFSNYCLKEIQLVFSIRVRWRTSSIEKLKPEHFEDIVAVTSLYRPGPMEEIPTYITRRHDPSKVEYLHEDLAPILKNTYGVIIYQDKLCKSPVNLPTLVMVKQIF